MNLLGIDFEEWFHPELIQKYITTKNNELSVVNGIDKILDLLRTHDTYTTFFMVGELLEAKPELMDKILNGGHEIAFHTMHHTRLDSMKNKQEFVDELKKFAELTSNKSKGFRAPSFSLNYLSAWAIDALVENGYQYDSSIVPAKTRLYGMPNAELKPYKITSTNLEKNTQDVIKAADVVLVTSGTATLETAILKKPMVVSQAPGVLDYIQPGVTGIVVPPGDPDALREAILRVLTGGSEIERMVEAAYRRVQSGFSLNLFVDRLLSLAIGVSRNET